MYSLVIPVYKNYDSLPELLTILTRLQDNLIESLQVIFVVDGSPDESYLYLKTNLPLMNFSSDLLLLSRNFGSFAAIRAGLKEATGDYIAIMAADLQEPPELIIKFFSALSSKKYDIALAVREKRSDPIFSKISSKLFWLLYRKFVQKEMPPGGIDMFACNKQFRDQLLQLNESNSSLISLLFWLGYRRILIPYQRLPRKHGKSAWSLSKKFRYLNDSIFSFTDLPIRILTYIGGFGLIACILFAIVVIIAKLFHLIIIPGYTTTLLSILFLIAFNTFSMGILGSYIWRTFENTKFRPLSCIMTHEVFNQERIV